MKKKTTKLAPPVQIAKQRRSVATRGPLSADPGAIAKAAKFDELGSTGLKRTGYRGLVDEEFLPELRGERAIKIYREMRDNDPVVGAIMFTIEMLARNAKWEVREGKDEHNEFVQSCIDDMSKGFGTFIADALSHLTYGFSWHEVVYKQRQGDVSDPSKRSRFTDGKIGWRKFPIRSQDSLVEWAWDEEGGIQAFVQQAPPDYKTIEIPVNRSLLFRAGAHKDSPEGRSLLRNAYRPWYFKNRIEVIEAIGIERDLAGLPVIYRSGEVAEMYDDELRKIVTNVRRDEQEGILMPIAYDENNNPLVKLELLSSAGSRQIDAGKVIDRYDKRIATTVLADFVLLGQDKVGSFALSSNKTDLFSIALYTILNSMAEVINQHAIPRLFALNSIKADTYPRLVPLDFETPDLKELGAYITNLAGAGMPLFPDEGLENHLREVAGLPERPDDPDFGKPMEPPAEPGTEAPPKDKAVPPGSAQGAPKKKRPGKPQAKPPASDTEE